jgi:hypothetical protein
MMLLLLLRTVWVNNTNWGAIAVVCMKRHVWALAILGQASTGMTVSCWAVVRVFPLLRGRVHRSVRRSFLPHIISFPLNVIMLLLLSKVTVQPTAVNTRIPNKEVIDRLGMRDDVAC